MIAVFYMLLAFSLVKDGNAAQNMSAKVLPKFSPIEKDLMNNLLINYSVYARPTTSSARPVMVDFDFKLGKLVKLDIKEQILIANTRVTMRWMDPSLRWNKTEHNGTNYLNIPSSLIWTPDILLHNTAVQDSKGKSDIYKARVRVNNEGTSNWMSPVTIQASCSLNIKWFPFDEQTCELMFGSISYTKKKLKLLFRKQPKGVSEMKAQFHYSSGDWVMKELKSQVEDTYYECCQDPFSIIKYTLIWRRLSGYWLLYLVSPCLCLSFIALFTFFIPAESGERTGFGITTVLAMSVYLLVISDKLPEKSDQSPLIGVLYIVLFFLMVGVLLSIIITTHLAFKKTKPPAYLKRFLKQKKNANPPATITPVTVLKNEFNSDAFEKRRSSQDALEMTCINRKPSLKRNSSVISPNEEESKYQEEWQEIAQKIDQKLFWFFTFLTIIGPSVVLIIYYV